MIRALPRASGVPAWIRYGLISGAFAFAVTLAANLVFLLARPAELCRAGPIMLPLSGLVAFFPFRLDGDGGQDHRTGGHGWRRNGFRHRRGGADRPNRSSNEVEEFELAKGW